MTTLHFIVSDKGSARAADRRAALRRLQLENPEISWKMHSLDELPDLKLDHSRQVSIVSVEQIQQAEELSKRLRSQGGVVGLDIDSLSSHKALREELADFFVTSNPEGKIARTLPDLFVLPQPSNDDENSDSIEEDLPLVTYPQNPSPDGVSDWLFVTPKASKGWILEAICREIGSRYRGTWEIVYNPKKLPKARNYFFAHYWNYMDQLRQNPHIREGRTFVWYTHPREIPFTEDEQLEGYRSATQVFFTCSEFLNNWIQKGLPKERGRVVLGGADRFLFQPHRRGQSRVGLSSSYYARKNPHVLLDLIRMMPHRHFHLVGREWDQFDRFNEMLALPNFTYETARYEDYPRIYAQFDVFLSMSILEGGPIPLLEAMMSNIIPVASRTGFAPDLIQHGQNGFIFDVDADAKTIAPLIDAAFDMTVDVRSTVIDYTWDNFSSEILAYGDTPHEFKPRARKMIGR